MGSLLILGHLFVYLIIDGNFGGFDEYINEVNSFTIMVNIQRFYLFII